MQVQRPTDEKGVLSEVSFTLVVNAHGALLGLTMDVEPKELLVVKNLVSGEEMHSLVIRVSEETASLKEVAIERPHAFGISTSRLRIGNCRKDDAVNGDAPLVITLVMMIAASCVFFLLRR